MAMHETTTFGELLRRYRLAAAQSQQSLAERAGLSIDAVRALEHGRRGAPRSNTIASLSVALDLSPTDHAAFVAAATHTVPTAIPPTVPTATTHTVHTEAAAAAPGLPTEAAPLPCPSTPLIGREREEARLTHLLQQGEARLLTLTGPGGVGKTRLALAVAAALGETYADGAIFVDLSALRDPDLVLPAVAQALRLHAAGCHEVHDVLLRALRPRRLLLLLDNFEQVAQAAPRVAALVAACPRLVVLVTSRTALRVRAEQRFRVPPLAAPAPDECCDGEEVAGYAALRLFEARARAVEPAFQLTAATVMPVATICRRLDGLPLAIELAAARVTVLPPAALLARLEQRLDILKGGVRDLPVRQQSLRATLDWSYDLLDANAQRLFARLGVFVGGCTLEAIAAVCNHDGALDVLEGLTALADHHLLRRTEGGAEPRFGMLETIHTYALERLAASGEAEALRLAHARYFLALAEAAEPELVGPAEGLWLARLARDHDNLRAVLGWALESGADPAERGGEIGLRLAAALWRFWHMRGHLDEGRVWLARLLATHEAGGDPAALAVRARALTAAAWAAQSQEDFAQAEALFAQCVALRRALGQADSLSDLLINGALSAVAQGDYGRATALLEESLALHRAQGNRESIGRGGLGLSLFRLGMVLRDRGEYARAAALYEECLALHRALGDCEGAAIALLGLGDIARDQGATEYIETYSEQSLALFEELEIKWGRGFALNNLALAAYQRGELAQARTRVEESVALFRELGGGKSLAEALTTQARIMRATGAADQVRAVLTEALRLAWTEGPRWFVAASLEEVAAVAVAAGQARRAARLLGAADALRRVMDAPLPPSHQADHERSAAAARAALGEETYAAAWAEGAALPLEEVVAAARGMLE